MKTAIIQPDYIFETSWEVCNKVGGIHTVLCTKASYMQKWNDRILMLGPELQKEKEASAEFIEDKSMFPLWREQALKEGLHIHTGYWDISGKPRVVLIDFTTLYEQKNGIFGHLWLKYGLDSLSGQWDYINPALFGYAAGMVIASFYRHQLHSTGNIIAQFHEWMTGTGILYLKEHTPLIATIFTTHATVAGRTLAGNDEPFYTLFKHYTGDEIARKYQVISKHSLEKTAAIQADCFTCVSEFTATECTHFLHKTPDFITPNGFDETRVPQPAEYDLVRSRTRSRIFQVVRALIQQDVPENSLLVIKSGRYEFRNKGIDIFIDSLELLMQAAPSISVVAIIFVPALDNGPMPELLKRLEHPDMQHPLKNEFLTHDLAGKDNDPIYRRILQKGLDNGPESSVKVIFVPAYMEGRDGVFDMKYYDILSGFDLAVFPSYYEPWGYTPLESLAFHVPAITSSLSGFAMAVKKMPDYTGKGLYIVERNDNNDKQATADIAGIIRSYAALSQKDRTRIQDAATTISKMFLWDNQIIWYTKAWDFALEKKKS